MENAKRMVLVDEKMLEYKPLLQHFQSKQDLSWKRPTEQSVKSAFSKQMRSTIDDPAIPEDVKVKHYRQNLNRFLHTKRKLDEEPPEPAVDELLDIKPEEPEMKKKKKKIKTKPIVDTTAKRTSKRIPKKPRRYADIDWHTW